MGIKGVNVSGVINDEVSGTDMIRTSMALDGKEGRIKEAIKRLSVTWGHEDIIRTDYMSRGNPGEVLVFPPLAYGLARKCPFPSAAVNEVTKVASLYGGKIPLHVLSGAIGNWSSLRSMR
jgi:hypothetical protein